MNDAVWDRFIRKTTKHPQTGCWIWNGAVDDRGYGRFQGEKVMIAHRFAYQHANRVVLVREQIVMHTCDNARCVNPEHLRVGTQSENAKERWNRTGKVLSLSDKITALIERDAPQIERSKIVQALSILGLSSGAAQQNAAADGSASASLRRNRG